MAQQFSIKLSEISFDYRGIIFQGKNWLFLLKMLSVSLWGGDPFPPYGQADRKKNVFLLLPLLGKKQMNIPHFDD